MEERTQGGLMVTKQVESAQVVVFATVRAILSKINSRLVAEAIVPDTSVVYELGLDSIRFVDLAVALEEALPLGEFPMQDWYDEETAKGARYTVRSLVDACVAQLERRAPE